jgi:hypothetical protein
MKRSPTEANVRDVLANVIGYDPDAPAWPQYSPVFSPPEELVAEVVEELGWSRATSR